MSIDLALCAALFLLPGGARGSAHPGGKPSASDPVPTYDPVDRLKELIETRDHDWDKAWEGEYYVSNNVWNKGGIGHYRQSVGIRRGPGGTMEAGWAWDWPDKNRAVAFPELVYGKNPWSQSSSTPKLPVRISDLRSLAVEFEFDHDGDGKRGTALQIWLTCDSAAEVSGISQEIMIWLTSDGIVAKGFMAEVNLGGVRYALTDDADLGRKLDWGYFAFQPATQIRKGKLELLAFFEFLASKGLVDKDGYVAAIHLGNEVLSGVGITLVKRYSVEVVKRE